MFFPFVGGHDFSYRLYFGDFRCKGSSVFGSPERKHFAFFFLRREPSLTSFLSSTLAAQSIFRPCPLPDHSLAYPIRLRSCSFRIEPSLSTTVLVESSCVPRHNKYLNLSDSAAYSQPSSRRSPLLTASSPTTIVGSLARWQPLPPMDMVSGIWLAPSSVAVRVWRE